jgi:glycosyltransferase involved in cell wall biosynthesis
MKICLYTGSALPKLGGQEAVVDALARALLQMGHAPTVLAPRPRLPLLPRDSELPYPVLRHPRFFSTRHFVSWYRAFLARAAKRYRFDVIHCHEVYPTGYVAALCRQKLGIPLVITSHGGDVRAGNARLVKSGMRSRFEQAITTADALISIGQFTREGFVQLGADERKIHMIPNGVDLLQFNAAIALSEPLDTKIVAGDYLLFLGRLSHRKGLDILLNALARLPATGGVELVIAGSGDEKGSIEKLVSDLKLADRIRLVGRVAGELKTFLLQNAMCIVVPSRGWEAFPLVVLEAYAAGRPVIGSRIAGLEDVVSDGITGRLVQAESVEDWVHVLQQVRSDPRWVGQAGQAARARVADYSWDEVARRHVQLYSGLIHQENAPGS